MIFGVWLLKIILPDNLNMHNNQFRISDQKGKLNTSKKFLSLRKLNAYFVFVAALQFFYSKFFTSTSALWETCVSTCVHYIVTTNTKP